MQSCLLTPVPRPLLRDVVFERLRGAIVEGDLPPGSRLRDGDLQKMLGVSRTPIREAVLRLEEAGLVVSKPGAHTEVAALDPVACAAAQSVVGTLHALAVTSSLHAADERLLSWLEAVNREFAEAVEQNDPRRALRADDEFHGAFVALAGNPVIEDALARYSPILRRMELVRFSSDAGVDSVAAHDRLIGAVRARDAALCREISESIWSSLDPHHPSVSGCHGLVQS